MSEPQNIYGAVATYGRTDDLLAAIRATRREGFACIEAYTPFPVEGLDEALDRRADVLPYVILICAIIGGAGGFFMQWYASVIDFPIVSGGKPYNSWPAFMIVTFELTVLAGVVGGLIGLLVACGLPRYHHPIFNARCFHRASEDRFFLCIEAADPRFDATGTLDFLRSHGARRVEIVEA